jgi:hypothetical protein
MGIGADHSWYLDTFGGGGASRAAGGAARGALRVVPAAV